MRYYDIRLDQQFWVNIADRYDILTQWIDQRYLMMSFAFIAGYTIAVAFSVPGAVIPDFIGRGIIWLDGCHYGGFSASLGALLVFLAARGACASFFQASGSRFHQPP